jgi:hypothetical protein
MHDPPKQDMHHPKMPHSTEIFAMKDQKFVSPDAIRSAFSAAMSAMYKQEVPAYGTLMELVADVNAKVLADDSHLHERLTETDSPRLCGHGHVPGRLLRPQRRRRPGSFDRLPPG